LYAFIFYVYQTLLDISKKYFDQTSTGYDNPKLRELYIGSYMEYIKAHPIEYDVIITGNYFVEVTRLQNRSKEEDGMVFLNDMHSLFSSSSGNVSTT
jgi:spermidine synthase